MAKMIDAMGAKMELTAERRRRIVEAREETIGKLAKEMGYREDLRKHDMIKFYNGHIAKLDGMLA